VSKYGFNYRVEVTHWTRSCDGDDWVDTFFWLNFDSLEEALAKAQDPMTNNARAIESVVLDMRDNSRGELVWKKDWIKNEVVDYTTIPDFDYHNREYD